MTIAADPTREGTVAAVTLTNTNTAFTSTAGDVTEFKLDITNLATPAEVVELWAEEKVLTGGTARRWATTTANGGAIDKILKLPPIGSAYAVVFKFIQTGGTGRAFDWQGTKLN